VKKSYITYYFFCTFVCLLLIQWHDMFCAADLQPSQELLACCVAHLLNMKHWDYLSSLRNTSFSGIIYV